MNDDWNTQFFELRYSQLKVNQALNITLYDFPKGEDSSDYNSGTHITKYIQFNALLTKPIKIDDQLIEGNIKFNVSEKLLKFGWSNCISRLDLSQGCKHIAMKITKLNKKGYMNIKNVREVFE